MPSILTTRGLVLGIVACILTPNLCRSQITPTGHAKPSAAIPATSPAEAAATPQAPLTPSKRPAHHARVTWQGGRLTVDADNSSLNQILREISRETGMKITGGVLDERVFGVYGPGAPGKILDTLLDGTGANMLLVLNDQSAPAELILTPRHGGASPPSPNAVAHDDDRDPEDLPPQQLRHAERRDSPPNPASIAAPPLSAPIGLNAPTAAGNPSTTASAEPASSTASSDTTPQQSPNGVKTPQQIYEQLLKMQQKTTPSQTTPQ
jgi:hypothetical protein